MIWTRLYIREEGETGKGKKILWAEHQHQAGCMCAVLFGPGRGLGTVLEYCKQQSSN